MSCKQVITIGRQFGSGGREIGKLLAQKLGIDYYDRELLTMAAKEAGVDPEIFENVDERAVNSLLYALSIGVYNMGNTFSPLNSMPANDKLYIAQHKIITEIADKKPCVIVGRCADYVLKDKPNVTRVFIYADMPYRLDRVKSIYNLEPDKAEATISKTDKTRANYYSFYTTQRWGVVQNYDLCVNSGRLGIDGSAELIKSYVEQLK